VVDVLRLVDYRVAKEAAGKRLQRRISVCRERRRWATRSPVTRARPSVFNGQRMKGVFTDAWSATISYRRALATEWGKLSELKTSVNTIDEKDTEVPRADKPRFLKVAWRLGVVGKVWVTFQPKIGGASLPSIGPVLLHELTVLHLAFCPDTSRWVRRLLSASPRLSRRQRSPRSDRKKACPLSPVWQAETPEIAVIAAQGIRDVGVPIGTPEHKIYTSCVLDAMDLFWPRHMSGHFRLEIAQGDFRPFEGHLRRALLRLVQIFQIFAPSRCTADAAGVGEPIQYRDTGRKRGGVGPSSSLENGTGRASRCFRSRNGRWRESSPFMLDQVEGVRIAVERPPDGKARRTVIRPSGPVRCRF